VLTHQRVLCEQITLAAEFGHSLVIENENLSKRVQETEQQLRDQVCLCIRRVDMVLGMGVFVSVIRTVLELTRSLFA